MLRSDRVSSGARAQVRAALGIAAVAVSLTALGAVIVRVGFASRVRGRLDFGFAGVPRRPAQALEIFVANGRMLTAVFAATVVAQLTRAAAVDGIWRGLGALLRVVIDAVIVVVACANVALVGAAIGAYGARMIRAVLPHGGLELASYAVALGAYLRVRRRTVAWSGLSRLAWYSVALLALAATVETYVRI